MMDHDTLERAALTLETRPTNDMYRKAWKAAAKVLRAMKTPEKLPDSGEQISSISQ
jgi:hypothetical protein